LERINDNTRDAILNTGTTEGVNDIFKNTKEIN